MKSKAGQTAARRALRTEELREKFQTSAYINELQKISEDYSKCAEAMDIAVTTKKRLTKKDAEQLQARAHQIEALKFKIDVLNKKADLNFRRLKFVLPELRSVELTDPQGKNPLGSLADALREAVGGITE